MNTFGLHKIIIAGTQFTTPLNIQTIRE